jgi:hypothetical protein
MLHKTWPAVRGFDLKAEKHRRDMFFLMKNSCTFRAMWYE